MKKMIIYPSKYYVYSARNFDIKKRATARPIKLKFHFSNTLRYWQSQ